MDIVCNYIDGETPVTGSIAIKDNGTKRRNIGLWISRYLSVGKSEWLVKVDPDCVITGDIVLPEHADVCGTLTKFKHGIWPLGGAYAIRREVASKIAAMARHPNHRFQCDHYIDRHGMLMPIEEDILSLCGQALGLRFAEWPGANVRYRPYWQTTEILDTEGFIFHPYVKEHDLDLPTE